jgi:hypothetical protein
MEITREFGNMELPHITSSYALQLIAKAPEEIKSEFKEKIAQGENPQPQDVKAAIAEAEVLERDPDTTDWLKQLEEGEKRAHEKAEKDAIDRQIIDLVKLWKNDKPIQSRNAMIGLELITFKNVHGEKLYKKMCKLAQKTIPEWGMNDFNYFIKCWNDSLLMPEEKDTNSYSDANEVLARIAELEAENEQLKAEPLQKRIDELERRCVMLSDCIDSREKEGDEFRELLVKEKNVTKQLQAEKEQLQAENEKLKAQMAEMEIVLSKQGEDITWLNENMNTIIDELHEESINAEKWEKTAKALTLKIYSMQLANEMPRLALPAPTPEPAPNSEYGWITLTTKNDTSVVFEPKPEPKPEQLKALELSKQGLSQRQIAKELNVGRSTIHHWLKECQ